MNACIHFQVDDCNTSAAKYIMRSVSETGARIRSRDPKKQTAPRHHAERFAQCGEMELKGLFGALSHPGNVRDGAVPVCDRRSLASHAQRLGRW